MQMGVNRRRSALWVSVTRQKELNLFNSGQKRRLNCSVATFVLMAARLPCAVSLWDDDELWQPDASFVVCVSVCVCVDEHTHMKV